MSSDFASCQSFNNPTTGVATCVMMCSLTRYHQSARKSKIAAMALLSVQIIDEKAFPRMVAACSEDDLFGPWQTVAQQLEATCDINFLLPEYVIRNGWSRFPSETTEPTPPIYLGVIVLFLRFFFFYVDLSMPYLVFRMVR